MSDDRLFPDDAPKPTPGDPSMMIPNTMPPFRRGEETSREAAMAAWADAPNKRARILAFIRSRGAAGATDDEGEIALGIRAQTYTGRRNDLLRFGLVVQSDMRRKTTSGCSAKVWVATEFAGGGG